MMVCDLDSVTFTCNLGKDTLYVCMKYVDQDNIRDNGRKLTKKIGNFVSKILHKSFTCLSRLLLIM